MPTSTGGASGRLDEPGLVAIVDDTFLLVLHTGADEDAVGPAARAALGSRAWQLVLDTADEQPGLRRDGQCRGEPDTSVTARVRVAQLLR